MTFCNWKGILVDTLGILGAGHDHSEKTVAILGMASHRAPIPKNANLRDCSPLPSPASQDIVCKN